MAYQPARQGVYYNPKVGRIVHHEHYATRIFWNTQMLDYLRRHFPTTLNEELAGCLGVSPRTMIRKARELGLEKDPEWLSAVWEERRKLAHVISKRKGYPGGFKKGERANPAGEFKAGEPRSEEMKRKQGEGMKRWYKRHPREASAKALKAWETRRLNSCNS
jgi:hypothetical protein